MRIASYNAATSTLGWIKQQQNYFGRAGALSLGSSPHGTSYLYLGGSGSDEEADENERFYLSISQINFDGTLYHQHYLEPKKDGCCSGKAYTQREKAPAIDHMAYWEESASVHWVFGTTRSHETNKKGQEMGIFKA